MDRVVIVTGATAGLGRAYAVALAQAGADVVLSGRRPGPLQELVCRSSAPRLSSRATSAIATSRSGSSTRRWPRYGRVDAVVNNAGAVRDRTLLKMSDDEFDEVIRGHVYGTFYVTRACARAMRSQGSGAVINIGSDSMIGAFGQSNYAAAKGAILGMTLTWARELARHGITCNCVLPNALTAMTEELPELLAAYRYGPPEAFPRALGSAAEVAPLIVLLASERGRGLNGLLLSLGGDKLSIWQPPAETSVAFLNGGWTVAELDAAWSSRSESTSQRRKGASMALHTADELTERLSRRRGDFRWRGQVLENVIEHPDFMPTLLSWGGWLYQAAFDPETAETMVARPDLNGEDCHVFWHIATSAEDLLQNLKAAQLLAERSPLTGYASIGRDELQALLVATHDLDREHGTALPRARHRVRQAIPARAADDGGGGHRRQGRPRQAPRPSRTTPTCTCASSTGPTTGIVVRGAKAHTSGRVGAEELIVIPTRAMREDEADYAVAFAIPVDAPGITLVARALNAGSDSEWEAPISSHDELAETFTIFNDVFVPYERVFLLGEWEYAGDVANTSRASTARATSAPSRQAAAVHRRRAADRRAQRRRIGRPHPREDHPDDPDGALDLGARRGGLAREPQRASRLPDPRSGAHERRQALCMEGHYTAAGSCSRSPAARSRRRRCSRTLMAPDIKPLVEKYYRGAEPGSAMGAAARDQADPRPRRIRVLGLLEHRDHPRLRLAGGRDARDVPRARPRRLQGDGGASPRRAAMQSPPAGHAPTAGRRRWHSRIAVDTGGTFTDVVVADDARRASRSARR